MYVRLTLYVYVVYCTSLQYTHTHTLCVVQYACALREIATCLRPYVPQSRTIYIYIHIYISYTIRYPPINLYPTVPFPLLHFNVFTSIYLYVRRTLYACFTTLASLTWWPTIYTSPIRCNSMPYDNNPPLLAPSSTTPFLNLLNLNTVLRVPQLPYTTLYHWYEHTSTRNHEYGGNH